MADNKDLKKFRGGIRLESTDAPANAEKGALYFDSTAKGLKVHDGDQFNDVGSGSSGGLDTFYVEDFRAQTLDVTNSGDTKFIRKDTGGGSGSSLNFIADSDEISEKTLKITVGTSNTDYLKSPLITLNNKQKGKTCSISFYYKTDSTYVDGDMKLEIYNDSETTALLSVDIKKNTDIKKMVDTFTIPSGASNIHYRFKSTVTNGGSKYLYVDDVEISQDPFVQADLGTITEWQDYTPALNSSTGIATDFPKASYRRVGDSIEVKFSVKWSSTGHASAFGMDLPSGLYFDDNKLPDASNYEASGYLGAAVIKDADVDGGNGYSDLGVFRGGLNHIKVGGEFRSTTESNHVQGAGQVWSNQFTTNDYMSGFFSAPIKDWGSTNTHIITPAKSNLTDWVTYTPDATQIGASGANENTGRYRRVGDSMEVTFELVGNGSPQAIMAVVGLPETTTDASLASHTYTYTPDFNKILSQGTILGTWWVAQDEDTDLIPRGTEGSTDKSGVIVALDSAGGKGHVLLSENTQGANAKVDANNWSEWGALGNDDKIYGTFTVPIESWGAQDSNFLAALPMTKWQKKTGTNITTTGAVSALDFANLTIGNTYKLHIYMNVTQSGSEGAWEGDLEYQHNGSELVVTRVHEDTNGRFAVESTMIFKATATTISCQHAAGGAGTVTVNEGVAILEELPMHTEVDIW